MNDPDVYSLTIQDGFYVAEIPRKYVDAVELLVSEITACSLGKHISRSIKESFNVLEGEQILDLKDEGLRSFLNGWL